MFGVLIYLISIGFTITVLWWVQKNNEIIHICVFDASKAFDRVGYEKFLRCMYGCVSLFNLSASLFLLAIKTGRYTLAKRNKNIVTVNQLEEQGKMTEAGGINLQFQHQNEMDQIIEKLSEVKIFKEHTDETLENLYRSEDEYVVRSYIHVYTITSVFSFARKQCSVYRLSYINVK